MAASTSFVRANALSYSHCSSVTLIADATFRLGVGWTGLVGANGAGKSTLLALMAGLLEPDEGELRVGPEGALVVLCPQIVEHLGDEVARFGEATEAAAYVLRGRLELDPAQLERWGSLSPGERKRWQIGAALAASPDVLLLDEPTNHIDVEASALLMGALAEFEGIGVLVSHDRALLDALCSSTLRVARGEVKLHPGSYSKARLAWEADDRAARERHDKLQADERALSRRLDGLRRDQKAASANLSTGKRMRDKNDSDARSILARGKAEFAQARIGQGARVTRKQLERTTAAREEIQLEKDVGRPIFIGYEPAPRARLVTLDRAPIMAGDTPLLPPVSFVIGNDTRVRIEGPNGAGKSTLLRAILAASTLPDARVLYLPQELTQAEVKAQLLAMKQMPVAEKNRVLQLVAALGAEPELLLASEQPSPGEARKLSIAMGLARHVWLLVLDEPTNHLDLPSIERLEAALKGYPGALVVVTHDARFAVGVASQTWRIKDGALVMHER